MKWDRTGYTFDIRYAVPYNAEISCGFAVKGSYKGGNSKLILEELGQG
ncbi:MAG: hypothetical protein LBF34_05300 [Puniceicoccales bacterium]|nr:hypothetical protein [Puniceicoccales bacterium]